MTMPDQPEESDELEALLRQPMEPVADDGFAARVVASLPARRRNLLRPAILLSASAVGFVLAGRWLPLDSLPSLDLNSLSPQLPQELGSWVMVITVMASLGWALVNAVSNEGDIG